MNSTFHSRCYLLYTIYVVTEVTTLNILEIYFQKSLQFLKVLPLKISYIFFVILSYTYVACPLLNQPVCEKLFTTVVCTILQSVNLADSRSHCHIYVYTIVIRALRHILQNEYCRSSLQNVHISHSHM